VEKVPKGLSAAGCMLVSTLLRYDTVTVQPLATGFAWLVKNPATFVQLAKDRRCSRVLEAVFSSDCPAIVPGSRKKMIRALLADEKPGEIKLGYVEALALDSTASWVFYALWREATGEPKLKQQLAERLLAREDSIRVNNWALWRKCSMHLFKTNPKQFMEAQEKQSKAKALFSDLLQGAQASKPERIQKKKEGLQVGQDEVEAKLMGTAPVGRDPGAAPTAQQREAAQGDEDALQDVLAMIKGKKSKKEQKKAKRRAEDQGGDGKKARTE